MSWSTFVCKLPPNHLCRDVFFDTSFSTPAKCKHVFAVEISFAPRKEVEVPGIESLQINCFIFCNSPNIVKDRLRHDKRDDIQKYNCRDCKPYFTINLGFGRMCATAQIITFALQLYFTGESFRNVQNFLKIQGVKITHVGLFVYLSIENK